MRSGALLLKSENDRFVEAPLVGTDVDLVVSGPTARARVTQIFHNPTDGWVEAVYVYPLPEGGAVDTLKMVIGERIVVGDIKERKDRARGLRAGQGRRPEGRAWSSRNGRTSSPTRSPISGRGETVVVQIEYQEPVRQSGGEFSLRLPLVVAPRYNPDADRADRRSRLRRAAAGAGAPTRCRTAIASRRRCSIRASNAPVNPVTITVRLQAGFPLGEVKSHHHAVKTDTVAETSASSRWPKARCRPIATSS